MLIQYFFDDEGGVEPTDPLGGLVLSDDKGNSLSLKATFIDVWLLSFLKAILTISEGEEMLINVLEERYTFI